MHHFLQQLTKNYIMDITHVYKFIYIFRHEIGNQGGIEIKLIDNCQS